MGRLILKYIKNLSYSFAERLGRILKKIVEISENLYTILEKLLKTFEPNMSEISRKLLVNHNQIFLFFFTFPFLAPHLEKVQLEFDVLKIIQ